MSADGPLSPHAKVLFLTADLGGNVPPILAVAGALVRRGVAVEIAGVGTGGTGASPVPFEPASAIDSGGGQGWRGLSALGRLMVGRDSSRAVRALIAERGVDAVIADCMLPAVLRGAIDSGVPVVALFHTLGGYWAGPFDRGPLGTVFAAFGLRPRALWERAAARLLLTDPHLDPGRSLPQLNGWTWTGTTEPGVEPGARAERPRVLVSLSASYWPGMLPVYRRIVDALAAIDVDAIVTTGGVDLGGVLSARPNVDVRGWVPHTDLLPHVDLLIGHGGHSTTMKALAHGVPLLVLPVNPTADQRYIGEVIHKSGLGRMLHKRAGVPMLQRAIEAMLADDLLRSRAQETGRRLRSAPDGAETAADQIRSVLARSGDGGAYSDHP
jgi:UDP-N-acetylglucosamine:LPS N-acetylglucosamine transferase